MNIFQLNEEIKLKTEKLNADIDLEHIKEVSQKEYYYFAAFAKKVEYASQMYKSNCGKLAREYTFLRDKIQDTIDTTIIPMYTFYNVRNVGKPIEMWDIAHISGMPKEFIVPDYVSKVSSSSSSLAFFKHYKVFEYKNEKQAKKRLERLNSHHHSMQGKIAENKKVITGYKNKMLLINDEIMKSQANAEASYQQCIDAYNECKNTLLGRFQQLRNSQIPITGDEQPNTFARGFLDTNPIVDTETTEFTKLTDLDALKSEFPPMRFFCLHCNKMMYYRQNGPNTMLCEGCSREGNRNFTPNPNFLKKYNIMKDPLNYLPRDIRKQIDDEFPVDIWDAFDHKFDESKLGEVPTNLRRLVFDPHEHLTLRSERDILYNDDGERIPFGQVDMNLSGRSTIKDDTEEFGDGTGTVGRRGYNHQMSN